MTKKGPALFPGSLITNFYSKIIRHPKYRGWVIVASLIYILFPFDISPDLVPVVGWIDDGVIATVLATEVTQLLLERRRSKREAAQLEAAEVEEASVDA
jgi:uncharacterized membrane protein YkvA (DUF1232 family)